MQRKCISRYFRVCTKEKKIDIHYWTKNAFYFAPLSGIDVNMIDRSVCGSLYIISHNNATAFASKISLREVAKSFHLIIYQGDKNGLRRTN